MEASFRFPDGRTARLTCSLFSAWLLRASATVEGSAGRVSVFNPIAPHFYHRLRVLTPAGTRSERVAGPSTYECQPRAFVAPVRDGAPVPTGPADAIKNKRVIDAVYAPAGGADENTGARRAPFAAGRAAAGRPPPRAPPG